MHDTVRINEQPNNMNWTHTDDTRPIFQNTGTVLSRTRAGHLETDMFHIRHDPKARDATLSRLKDATSRLFLVATAGRTCDEPIHRKLDKCCNSP